MSNPTDAEMLAAQEAAMIYMLRHKIDLVAKILKTDPYLPGEIAVIMKHEIETGRQTDAALANIVRDVVRLQLADTYVYDAELNRELQK